MGLGLLEEGIGRKKEKAYKDTLYDFRDILELNGKEIFEKIVTDYKNRIPNRKHYLLMMEHYDELEKNIVKNCVRRNVILWNYGRKLLPGWRKRVNIL